MKRKLGIISECLHDTDPVVTLDLIQKAGFETFFTGRYHDNEVARLREKADSLGLIMETIHAPFKGINNMWLAGMDYLDIYNKMKESIDSACAHHIPTVVAHVSSGWNAPQITDLGLSRFDELVIYAGEKNVNLAFENLRKIGNLAYFADRYEKMEHVRFCLDCGHEHCYTKTISWMDIFGKRLICTHIHDNLGRGEEATGDPDLHWLPFEGNVDYAKMIQQLDEYQYEGPLTLEVSNHDPKYAALSNEEFLATCFERIKKISEM